MGCPAIRVLGPGLNASTTAQTKDNGKVIITGTKFTFPLINEWIKGFQEKYPEHSKVAEAQKNEKRFRQQAVALRGCGHGRGGRVACEGDFAVAQYQTRRRL